MNISQTPRFGASFNVAYGANLKPTVFAQAAELSTAQEALAGRVAQIKDQVDPIGINVQLANEGISAKLTTRENGEKTLAQAAGQTVADFANSLVELAETMAATFVSKAEQNAAIMKQANEFVNNLLIASTDNKPMIMGLNANSEESFELALTFASGGITMGGTFNDPGDGMQQLIKAPYQYGTMYTLSNAMDRSGDSGKLSVATKQGKITLLKYTPPGGKEVDLLNASSFDSQAATKLGTKANNIFAKVEADLRAGNIRR